MLKFGLIGCGRIGSMHADILHHEDDVILESVFDINTNLANGVSKKKQEQRFVIMILNYFIIII